MKLRAKKKEQMNLATEIICEVKRWLIICRIALVISLAGNIALTAGILKLKKRGNNYDFRL